MKYLLINASVPEKAPYLRYYIDIFERLGYSYDVVNCDRHNTHDRDYPDNYFFYCKSSKPRLFKRISSINYFIGYIKYIRGLLNKNNYSGIIVFTLGLAPFCYPLLKNKYKQKYIFDIRDYSEIYENYLVRILVKKILTNSFINCISSPGFKSWLPKNHRYVISHNISRGMINNYQTDDYGFKESVRLLTIGQIRDVGVTTRIVDRLSNCSNYSMTFVGTGTYVLERYVKEHKINNIYFKGAYLKEDELDIVSEYDMINAYMPNNILSSTLLSNRLYLALITGKPVIVSDNSTQAEYVRKYNLGIVLKPEDDIVLKLEEYIELYCAKEFYDGRLNFLQEVLLDVSNFENVIKQFIDYTKDECLQ